MRQGAAPGASGASGCGGQGWAPAVLEGVPWRLVQGS